MTETAVLTDSAQTGLKVIVERAVRPVRAPLARKKKMREELLGHVAAVFEEESARLGDERAALAETARRFGGPAEVAADLQRSVGARERFGDRIERLTKSPPGATRLYRATRWALVIAGMIVVVLAVAGVPIVALDTEPWRLRIALMMLAMIAAGSVVLTFAFVLLSDALRRAVFVPAGRRSIVRALGVGVLSCLIPAAVLFAFYFVAIGDAGAALAHLRRAMFGTPAILLVPAVLLLATREGERERRYVREWADLRLD